MHLRILRNTSCAVILFLLLMETAFSSTSTGTSDVAPQSLNSMQAMINVAGRQRMLSQRIVKAYLQVQLGLETENSNSELSNALKLFQDQLDQLKSVENTRQEKHTLAKVDEIWTQLKDLLVNESSPGSLVDINYLSEDLLYSSDRLVQLLQDRADTPIGELVNISGRQRMLSQRLAKLTLLRAKGLDTISLRAQLTDVQNEFVRALEKLRLAPENTPEIRSELEEIILQWTWFNTVLAQDEKDNFQLIVIDTSEEILLRLEKVTSMYANISA